eukprot:scaffold26568_cov30-Tisochrysis_lutea.AAC.1
MRLRRRSQSERAEQQLSGLSTPAARPALILALAPARSAAAAHRFSPQAAWRLEPRRSHVRVHAQDSSAQSVPVRSAGSPCSYQGRAQCPQRSSHRSHSSCQRAGPQQRPSSNICYRQRPTRALPIRALPPRPSQPAEREWGSRGLATPTACGSNLCTTTLDRTRG